MPRQTNPYAQNSSLCLAFKSAASKSYHESDFQTDLLQFIIHKVSIFKTILSNVSEN